MIGEYAAGSLVEVPGECPCCEPTAPCDVVQHGLRARKTGPEHALAVCRCHAHGLCFSVYPAGFVPYARRPLLEASGADFSYADAALDAAAGIAWPRSASGGSDRWWTTQRRLLRRLCEVFGAAGIAGRDRVAVALGLPLRLLAHVAAAVGYRARGQAVVAVLDMLGDDLERLLLAGALTGSWGRPWRWRRAPPRLEPLVPAHLTAPTIPSTTSERMLRPGFS